MAMRNGQQSGAGIYLKSGLIITAAHLTAVDAKMSARVAPQGRDREHALVDAKGMAFGFGYSRRAGLLTIALPTFAAALEIGAKLDTWSPCQDERFLGRCGGIVAWSWIIVRVFEIQNDGYPKVSASSNLDQET